jgi:chromosome segregation ATPase
MNDLFPWLNAHLLDLGASAAALVCAILLILLMAWLASLVYAVSVWGARRRLAYLRLASDQQVVQLQIRKRATDDGRMVEQLRTLQASLAASQRREEDCRRLQAALEENLTGRTARTTQLEEDLQHAREALEELDEVMTSLRDEATEIEKGQQKLETQLLAATDELTQRDQVIHLLESQLKTQANTASMASAGMEDLKRELTMLRERHQNALEQLELYKRMNLQDTPR